MSKEKAESDRILVVGKGEFDRCDNEVISARYTVLSFFPKVRKFLLQINDCFVVCFFSGSTRADFFLSFFFALNIIYRLFWSNFGALPISIF